MPGPTAPMYTPLKRYLSSRQVSVIAFIIAFLAKAALCRIFLDIGYDKSALLLTAKNLLHGHGISIGKVAMSDVASKYYEWYVGWPPGYCLIIAPFLYFLENHFMLACYIVDCLAVLLFLWHLRKIAFLIGLPVWLTNLFILFQGLFINDYIESSHPTDFLALAFFVSGLYYFLKLAILPTSRKTDITLSLFFFYFSSLVRYKYIPVVLDVSCLLLLSGIIQKRRAIIQTGGFMVVLLFIAIAGMLAFQKTVSGHMYYYQAARKGFYPRNLLFMWPFCLAVFLNLNFYAVQLSGLLHLSYTSVIRMAKWINLVFPFILIYFYIRFFFRKAGKINKPFDVFILYAGGASLATVGMLICLSVTNESNIGPPLGVWTFVMDGRYFALPILVLQLLVFYWLGKASITKNIFLKMAGYLLIASLCFESAHGLYFLAKNYTKSLTPFDAILKNTPEVNYVSEFITAQKKSNPTRKTVVASLEVEIEYFTDWYGGYPLLLPRKMENFKPQTKEPVLLLIAVENSEFPLFNDFLAEKNLKPIGTAGKYYFYRYDLAP